MYNTKFGWFVSIATSKFELVHVVLDDVLAELKSTGTEHKSSHTACTGLVHEVPV